MKQRDLDYENSEDMRKEGPTADRLGSIKMRRTLDQEGKVKHGPIGSIQGGGGLYLKN